MKKLAYWVSENIYKNTDGHGVEITNQELEEIKQISKLGIAFKYRCKEKHLTKQDKDFFNWHPYDISSPDSQRLKTSGLSQYLYPYNIGWEWKISISEAEKLGSYWHDIYGIGTNIGGDLVFTREETNSMRPNLLGK